MFSGGFFVLLQFFMIPKTTIPYQVEYLSFLIVKFLHLAIIESKILIIFLIQHAKKYPGRGLVISFTTKGHLLNRIYT